MPRPKKLYCVVSMRRVLDVSHSVKALGRRWHRPAREVVERENDGVLVSGAVVYPPSFVDRGLDRNKGIPIP